MGSEGSSKVCQLIWPGVTRMYGPNETVREREQSTRGKGEATAGVAAPVRGVLMRVEAIAGYPILSVQRPGTSPHLHSKKMRHTTASIR